MSPPPVLVQDLCVRLDAHLVLDHIHLRVEAGDFLAIIGPNGGGKSTLLRSLLGLTRLESGSVLLWGQPPCSQRRRVGYVPQHSSLPTDFPATVEDVAAMGRLYRRPLLARLDRQDRDTVASALERLGLSHKAREQASRLSGGERQKLLIARALCTEPEMLLLDEPTASLDAPATEQVYALLEDLGRRMPIVLITHDLGVISQCVRSVACLNRSLHYHGGRELSAEAIQAAYGCPVDLIAHGHPHWVLGEHSRKH